MRHSCLDCVRKHLAQASILMDEAALGYPHHRWLAVGHLAEAESECLREHPAFAREIRACRLSIMADFFTPLSPGGSEVCIEDLIRAACVLAGETLAEDPANSKKFLLIPAA